MVRQTTRAIARKWGVSARDARKHFAAGTTPDQPKLRRTKSEASKPQAVAPAAPVLKEIDVSTELSTMQAALERVISAAEFTDDDLDALRGLLTKGHGLLEEWEQTVAEVEGVVA